MKRALIAVLCIILFTMTLFLVSCQKQEQAASGEKAAGYGEKAKEATGGYGEKAKEAVAGYGEKAKEAVGGYGEKAKEAAGGYGK